MIVRDLGSLGYRDAWAIQEETHARVVAGQPETLLLVEHPPVITFGRRGEVPGHLLASSDLLCARGVELVQSDRGGDVTFHGPGQLVVYPIVRLIDHRLSIGAYVHALERAVVTMLAGLGVKAYADPNAVGVWADYLGRPAKLCAVGVRIKRGVSLHGIALNVTTDLSCFDLIVPCGLVGRSVTSLRQLLGEQAPQMAEVKTRTARAIHDTLDASLDAK